MRSTTMRLHALLPLAALAFGCAQGGKKETPQSEVKLAATHHMWALLGAKTFSAFPISPNQTSTDRGLFLLQDNSMYRVSRNGNQSNEDPYALSADGYLAVYVPRTNQSTLRYSGAYGLMGGSDVYYFTDRFASASSSFVGLFWGTKLQQGVVPVEGDWHLFTQHIIYSTSAILDPSNVGRTVAGSINIDSAGVVTDTGPGLESTGRPITFTGMAQTFADARVDLTLDYTDLQGTDTRLFSAGVGNDVVLGIDEDETDGESGLIALVRKRTTPADRNAFAGTYFTGIHTIFVSPSRPGTDAAHGTIQFNNSTGFTLEAVGADGIRFTYSGSYVLDDDGKLTLSVSGTNETWTGAVDETYRTLVIADNVIEQRTGQKPPELNLLLGIREVDTP